MDKPVEAKHDQRIGKARLYKLARCQENTGMRKPAYELLTDCCETTRIHTLVAILIPSNIQNASSLIMDHAFLAFDIAWSEESAMLNASGKFCAPASSSELNWSRVAQAIFSWFVCVTYLAHMVPRTRLECACNYFCPVHAMSLSLSP
eukprot:TRINITY_DN8512_c0_g1_i2.p1 TRINITY_DN8512_c0_g1~~TRINITY_DN8512_c0_g1_i2.p1  ORF type:complete len:148 (+),score=15.94 TRINITY_DN8512_c0_g1_i2:242-685(+)